VGGPRHWRRCGIRDLIGRLPRSGSEASTKAEPEPRSVSFSRKPLGSGVLRVRLANPGERNRAQQVLARALGVVVRAEPGPPTAAERAANLTHHGVARTAEDQARTRADG
jgi:hypothetical protein